MIDKLEMLLALSRERHFGRAAESLGVSQPTLWARRIVADARALREEARLARLGLTGTLRLAAIPTALAFASRLSAAFTAAHPRARVAIASATSAAILDGLDGLSVDAGISYLDEDALGRASALPLYDESYALVVRDDHPLAARPRLAWSDLGGLDLCLLTPDMQNRRIVSGHLAEAGLTDPPRVETNSTIVLVAHVLAGPWATILPRGAAEVFLQGGPLRAVPLDATTPHRVGLLAPRREPRLPLVAALLAEARKLAVR